MSSSLVTYLWSRASVEFGAVGWYNWPEWSLFGEDLRVKRLDLRIGALASIYPRYL